MSNVGLSEILLIFCVVVIFAIVFLLIPYWRIFKKAGLSRPFELCC